MVDVNIQNFSKYRFANFCTHFYGLLTKIWLAYKNIYITLTHIIHKIKTWLKHKYKNVLSCIQLVPFISTSIYISLSMFTFLSISISCNSSYTTRFPHLNASFTLQSKQIITSSSSFCARFSISRISWSVSPCHLSIQQKTSRLNFEKSLGCF